MRISILLGSIFDDKFEICYVDNTGRDSKKMPRPYSSIGSGADESDKVLSRYVSELPRSKRNNIKEVEGLIKLIEATNASANLNIGVGGNSSIVYIDEKGVRIPEENECILASEIVEGYTRGLLNKAFAYESIEKLVLDGTEFEFVEKKMRKSAKDWDKLDSVLRGYKV